MLMTVYCIKKNTQTNIVLLLIPNRYLQGNIENLIPSLLHLVEMLTIFIIASMQKLLLVI